MGFDETQFPTDISYRSRGGPQFRTNVIETDGGTERRVSHWSTPRYRYDVSYGIKTWDQLSDVLKFYKARRGVANGFRFKDFLDFSTASDGRSSPASDDGSIETGNGAEVDFQMKKVYTQGGVSVVRDITKPITDTMVCQVNGTPTTAFSVNTTTGIITFDVAPPNGQDIEAGCEFDIPVRFANESDESMRASLDSFDEGGVESIPLVELVNELPSHERIFYGGAAVIAYSSDITVTINNGRVISLDPQSGGLLVKLPALTGLSFGGPQFVFKNVSGANSTDVTNNDESALVTLAVGEFAQIYLGYDASSVATWFAV